MIQSNTFIERITAHSVGIAYPAIAEMRLGAFPLALPPTEAEQLALVEYIKSETRTMDAALRRAQREIDLLREYRTCLIANVVTGKLDVSGVKLPALDEVDMQNDLDIYKDSEAEEMDDIENVDMVEQESET